MFGFDEEKIIRSGSFGNVYRVKKGDEYFALKEMNDKGLRDREKKFLALADHGLFPKYIDSFDDEKYYILEEYIWGMPLDKCIDLRGGFAQPESTRYAIGIADGIAFLQQSDGNILFRDLKAENLIVQPDGEIRLVDLGAACFLDEAKSSLSGTRGSSAPEQFEKGASQGMYSDVYAFGRLFYYMLTGKRPSPDSYSLSIRSVDKGYSACLELLIRQCTSKDPSLRIPDMYGVLERLVDMASGSMSHYKKLEKNAESILKKDGLEEISYSRNVQS